MISVVAAGAEPLQYSWTYNGAPVDGQARPELVVSNALKASHQGIYKAKVRPLELHWATWKYTRICS